MVSCIDPRSPLGPSWRLEISNRGAPSMLPAAPGNCTATCLPLAFRTIEAISKEGDNSTVAIWNEPVTRTDACCEGVSGTGADSKFETSCNPATVKEGEPTTFGLCCDDGARRRVPRPP